MFKKLILIPILCLLTTDLFAQAAIRVPSLEILVGSSSVGKRIEQLDLPGGIFTGTASGKRVTISTGDYISKIHANGTDTIGTLDVVVTGDGTSTLTYNGSSKRGTLTVNITASAKPDIMESGVVVGTGSARINFNGADFDLSQNGGTTTVSTSPRLIFIGSNTAFVVPSGVSYIKATMLGAGGGGGSGGRYASATGGAGGGGGCRKEISLSTSSGDVINIFIGIGGGGGAGVSSGNGNVGISGGNTTLWHTSVGTITASGGSGGTGGPDTVPAAGGVGGGTISDGGILGHDGVTALTQAGANGAGSLMFGIGGVGSDILGDAGGTAAGYGAGGGGSRGGNSGTTGTGGTGTSGMCIIEY